MISKKLKLSELKVKSFVTLPEKESKKVKGGGTHTELYVNTCNCSDFCTNLTNCCVYPTEGCTQVICGTEAYTCTEPTDITRQYTCVAECVTVNPNIGCM